MAEIGFKHTSELMVTDTVTAIHMESIIFSLPHTLRLKGPCCIEPERSRIHSLHPVEEAGEGGDLSEVEAVGNLGDAQRGLAQQEGGFHE